MSDTLQQFIFEQGDVRGEHVTLDRAYRDILAIHHYPAPVANLLGEFLAAASLLTAILKFEGSLILQVRGNGEIPLIMAESNSRNELRAIAQNAGQALGDDFHRLLGDGQLAITIEPRQGRRYQGIVSLDGDSLAECLETYFRQSEQLATRLWLAADSQRAVGLMLQELPSVKRDPEHWQHLVTLAETVSTEELLTTPADQLLYRLYHQDPLRLFDGKAVSFNCSCSRARFEHALRNLGEAEINSILAEQGQIETHCEFCNRRYLFTPQDLSSLTGTPPATRH